MSAVTAMNVPQRKAMDTGALKKFAQEARRTLRDQVSAKLVQVLAETSAARREAPKAVQQLEREIGRTSRDQVIERVAYTWFNRFTALRFMDANGYTAVRVVTPADGQTRPEILSEAMAGVIGDEVPEAAAVQIRALLDSRAPSSDPQGEAYRRLLVAFCNHWHTAMPFLFERIDDYSELLMPKDLLSQTSVLARVREVMTNEACRDVEIIGWLYQFYISEKKDEVFAGLKKNQKITSENIPAATQLFTPHWIVRYLVENSLGRLWLLNRPGSRLAERMDYYIEPDEPETDFIRIARPEDIRICDPACGSGHMLTYAFDLLYAIYEEEGYEATAIPGLILKHNLTGVEIDERAGALAAFALAMKAAAKLGRRRFLRIDVNPAIVVLQDVTFTAAEMQEVAAMVGRDLFTDELCKTLGDFGQAKDFGSLIVPKLRAPADALRFLETLDFGGDLLLNEVRERVAVVLRMAEVLSPRYQVVVANPPYMGGKGMNGVLSTFMRDHYRDSKSDLFSAFIERGNEFVAKDGYNAMVTMESWMFLSSYEKMRTNLLATGTIKSMVHMPYLGKGGTSMGINFGTTAFVLQKSNNPIYRAKYCCVRHFETDCSGVPLEFPPNNERLSTSSIEEFKAIPGQPIAYWLGERMLLGFSEGVSISQNGRVVVGLQTGDNERFIRDWQEISADQFRLSESDEGKWVPYVKGGDFRKWYGNKNHVLDWRNNGDAIIRHPSARPQNRDFYFRKGITYTNISTSYFAARYFDARGIFDQKGSMIFWDNRNSEAGLLAFLLSKPGRKFIEILCPTMDFNPGSIGRVPALLDVLLKAESSGQRLISISKADWDAYEIAWDFSTLQLLSAKRPDETLEAAYTRCRAQWQAMTDEMRRLEEENNRLFIDAYGLQNELTPEVPIEEITLTCNPAYRYGVKGSEEDREKRLRADTMAEFLSYAVGCMFGRYSLDAPGLILANQGDGIEEYLAKVPEPTFAPDVDNVIPILDGDWFADDITERLRKFLRTTFGEAHLQENLAFVEEALGKKVRSYFTRDFYTDHVRRYRKRPIYWLFSSPKGTFNALIYMHRYRPDTVSLVLNEYLREFRNKLEGHRRAQEALSISSDASPAQKTKAIKEIEATGRQIEELDAWERDVLFPLATQKIEIDLDDGVKVNYPKFGSALKPIKGLNDADD